MSQIPSLEITNYFYNPNIQPNDEYYKRLETLHVASKDKSELVIDEEYVPSDYLNAVQELAGEFPKRCLECYRIRLEKTAKFAKENNYDSFSTTLLVSPYQDHEALKGLGKKVGADHGVDFYYTDWRPYFRDGQKEAREMELYRQKYCGCIYSLSESKVK